MRAKFIYEKFEEESDPIQDIGIGLIGKLKNIHTKKNLLKEFPYASRVINLVSRSVYAINKEHTLFITADHEVKGTKPHYFMDFNPQVFEIVRVFQKLEGREEKTIWYKPYN
jgi:hypothetical protein